MKEPNDKPKKLLIPRNVSMVRDMVFLVLNCSRTDNDLCFSFHFQNSDGGHDSQYHLEIKGLERNQVRSIRRKFLTSIGHFFGLTIEEMGRERQTKPNVQVLSCPYSGILKSLVRGLPSTHKLVGIDIQLLKDDLVKLAKATRREL